MAEESETKSVLGDRFKAAYVYALNLHAGQKRKGTEVPYFSHLLAVADLVREDGGSEDEVIAALLHDAIEDQGGEPTRQVIRRRFGDRVVEIVNGCTDTDETPKPPWRERKQRYLERLRSADPSVLRVCAADKLHNARSILADLRRASHRAGSSTTKTVWERFKGGREGTLWYYRQLVSIFRERGPHFFAEELDRVIAEL